MNSVWNSCHLFFVLKTDGNLELVDVHKALFFAVFGQPRGTIRIHPGCPKFQDVLNGQISMEEG